MRKRVVITGLGVVSPNGVGVPTFLEAIKNGDSGIKFHQNLKDLNFSCQIGGAPVVSEEKKLEYFTTLQLRNFNCNAILYGVMAGMEAISDAKIQPARLNSDPLWDLGIVFGVGTGGIDKIRELIYKTDEGNVRRLGSSAVIQSMASGVSAYLSGILGAGNSVSTNSSACATGTEAILMGYERIASGKAKQMLCGSSAEDSPYIWGGFDAMKVITYKHNDNPTKASRPLSETASGFVPGSGAGALVLESMENAEERGAKIYAEIIGGAINSGGQRNNGSMTAPNSIAVQNCIKEAIKDANINSKDIDYINGHLTATLKDAEEINNWCKALDREGSDFPYINSLKGMTGHCLAACGSIEAVSTILQMHHSFIFPNINCEDINPEINNLIDIERIPQHIIKTKINIAAKASFGFGDVNACIIFKKK